jgi:phytoene dehydrogenase-like protein
VPRYLPLLRQVGRPLASVLRRHGLDEWTELRRVLEPLCRITVQVGVDEAEAPFALGALDAMVRGAAHVHGGMGALADALVEAVRRAGGRVRFADRARGLRAEAGGWRVDARKGALWAPRVLANVLPQQLTALSGVDTPSLRRLSARVEGGWGAAMAYLQVASEGLPLEAHHLDLVADPDAPWLAGNHVFCSVSAADEARTRDGLRTVVASTHVPLDADMAEVHAAMAATLARRAPELRVVDSWTASPRTFERFTKRHRGLVGGIPRRAGLGQYLSLWPRPAAPGLWLVGDSVLLGQSTLSAAVSGARVAASALEARVQAVPPGAEHHEAEEREARLDRVAGAAEPVALVEVRGGGHHHGHGHQQG